MMEVRRLNPRDVDTFQALRLESLRFHPDAFGSSFDEEADWSLDDFRRTLTNSFIWSGFQRGTAQGIVGFFAQPSVKAAHKGVLWGMYVRQEARGSGLADMLVEAVLEHARTVVELVQLSVTSHNDRAKAVYERHGFIPYGIERRSLKIGGDYYDEELRVRFLTGQG